jgi:hypothetical protein
MFMREAMAFCCILAAWQMLAILVAQNGERMSH